MKNKSRYFSQSETEKIWNEKWQKFSYDPTLAGKADSIFSLFTLKKNFSIKKKQQRIIMHALSCIILKMHDTSINFKGLYFNIHSQRQKLELLSLREERNWEGDGP